ncbi:hypothetical protein PBI_CHIDIEBERE_1 [Gordonia phage Chidiebere]|uniref:Uncharacterized protein n=1 Tax=Gordonia phage Chidiebere TaxID=2656530 RepID=A0A649VMH0_9CAUD|nr:hypothetical protein PQD14_gp001 [Gordonia phage Chidiebere]QGJ92893.1 hypothetical protein PBI_CHIDIEBERE_1 [Gordonia phage Chidiebere]
MAGAPTRVPKRVDRKTGVVKYDWEPVKRDFVEGIPTPGSENDDDRVWPNLRELAEQHEIPYVRVRKRAANERWTVQRQQAQTQAAQERVKKRARRIETNALEFDDRSFNVAKLGMGMVTARLAEIGQEMNAKKSIREQAIQDLQQGLPINKTDLYSAIRYGELDALANAATKFQELGHKALGTDSINVNVTGGGDTNVAIVSVTNELARDDDERLGEVFSAMAESGLLPKEVVEQLALEDHEPNSIPGDIVDADVVEEETPNTSTEMYDEDDTDLTPEEEAALPE